MTTILQPRVDNDSAEPAACPACGSGRVTSLAMTLTDGTPVDFLSCHDCEHRSWSHAGRPLSFADVIVRATKPKARSSAR